MKKQYDEPAFVAVVNGSKKGTDVQVCKFINAPSSNLILVGAEKYFYVRQFQESYL